MTDTGVTWMHGEGAYTRHAFKNALAGYPSYCGRGRYPQDTTPPAKTPPLCHWCQAKSTPPDGAATGRVSGHVWGSQLGVARNYRSRSEDDRKWGYRRGT